MLKEGPCADVRSWRSWRSVCCSPAARARATAVRTAAVRTAAVPRPGGADPVELVNLWRVSDAEGEPTETWLRLDASSYQLWRDCGGFLEGGWAASGTVFVASTPFAVNGDCGTDPWPTVRWLEDTRAYEAAGDGWRLLDVEGEVLATLTIEGAPEPIPTAADFFAEPPDVTDDILTRLAEPAALPGGRRR